MQLADDPAWLERAENCLIFGPSGVGKTHVAAGLALATVERGKRAKFFAATTLVQQLQQAKLQLQLPATLKKLDRFDLLVIDDLGYVKKSEAETSVLFELIAHRYERKSLLVTANQPLQSVGCHLCRCHDDRCCCRSPRPPCSHYRNSGPQLSSAGCRSTL